MPNPASNAGLVAGCAALLASKDTLEGGNRNPLNWAANLAVSDWTDVTIASNRVSKLKLSNKNLYGAIPAQLSNLSNLEELDLRSDRGYGTTNLLAGAIPAELGNLANLITLNLSYNSLTGKIPAELGNLAKLEWLWLENNQLTGAIPAEIGNLANLDWLDLANNRLTGAIPAELGNPANLMFLDLRGNRLTGCVPLSLRDTLRRSPGRRFCDAAASTPTPTATSAPGATPTPTASQLAAQCSNGAAAPNPDRNTGMVADCAALLASKPILEGTTGSLNWSANRVISDWYGITTSNNRVIKIGHGRLG